MKTLLIFVCLCSTAFAQDIQPTAMIVPNAPAVQETGIFARSEFHKSVVKAAKEMRKKGELTRAQELKLRVALFSPAFQKHCEDVAVVQMVFSGSDSVPMSADGMVDRASIDWDGLIDFLTRLIPILLQLLEIFGGAV